jgi:hypothetical protein
MLAQRTRVTAANRIIVCVVTLGVEPSAHAPGGGGGRCSLVRAGETGYAWGVRKLLPLVLFGLASGVLGRALPVARAKGKGDLRCPSEMVRVHGFCVDRWEISTVDSRTGAAFSPFYPPNSKLASSVRDSWLVQRSLFGDAAARAFPLPELPAAERGPSFEPRAESRAAVVPQAYLSYHLAKLACENAGKRLCTRDEWVTACRGAKDRDFPYGDAFRAGRCNVHRAIHPGYVLHAASSIGLLDPRLNLVLEGDDPLLRLTGETATCESKWGDDGIFDMVGNLDEWVDEEMFLGGFYAFTRAVRARAAGTRSAPRSP